MLGDHHVIIHADVALGGLLVSGLAGAASVLVASLAVTAAGMRVCRPSG